MKRLTPILYFLLLYSQTLASSTLTNSDRINREINQSELIFLGSISDIRQLAFFNNTKFIGSTLEQASKAAPNDSGATAIYCANLKTSKVVLNKTKQKAIKDISIVWTSYAPFDGKVIESVVGSMCPPVSFHALKSQDRIWFIAYKHGLWHVVSDQHPNLLPHIKECIKTGKSVTLDQQFKKEQEEGNESIDPSDPFYTK